MKVLGVFITVNGSTINFRALLPEEDFLWDCTLKGRNDDESWRGFGSRDISFF